MAQHNEIGKLGENIATEFLKRKGLKIVDRNYNRPYGELDIVARENEIIRFVEVKSVSYETNSFVSRERIRPEENMHPQKIKRLKKIIQTYIVSHETDEWAFDLVLVYINQEKHSAQVKWIKDIILE